MTSLSSDAKVVKKLPPYAFANTVIN